MRRLIVGIAAAVLGALTLLMFVAPTQGYRSVPMEAAGLQAVDPNQPTLIWGAFAKPRGNENYIQSHQNLEAQIGRQLAAVREYLLWDEPFPSEYHTWLRDTGRLPLFSVKPQRLNGSRVLWRDIANAAPGSAVYNQIVLWADRMKAFAEPVYFTFNHEPEASASTPNGTDAEFIAAWRKVITVFRDRGVTNAKYMWIMTGYSFHVPPSDSRQASKWYPGDAYVDALGADEYNAYTCRVDSDAPWKSLASEIEPFRRFGLNHPAKEMWLAEYGSFEDPQNPGRKAQWINDARAAFKSDLYSQFRGILYFHANRPGTPCVWWIDSSPSALSAWAAMGQDVFYTRTHGDPPPPPPPPSGKDALFVVGSMTLGAGDAAVRDRLVAGGYSVVSVDDGAVTAGDATGRDVVLVSSTSDSQLVKATLRDVAAPVVIWKPALYDDMGLTPAGAYGVTKTTTVAIVNAAHPLAAGRTGSVTLLTAAENMPWGQVEPSASVVATVSGNPAIFAYSAGATLPGGGNAAGCRVGFPAYHTSPSRFTVDGGALFDVAVAWADACIP
jgi:hypothetical protein